MLSGDLATRKDGLGRKTLSNYFASEPAINTTSTSVGEDPLQGQQRPSSSPSLKQKDVTAASATTTPTRTSSDVVAGPPLSAPDDGPEGINDVGCIPSADAAASAAALAKNSQWGATFSEGRLIFLRHYNLHSLKQRRTSYNLRGKVHAKWTMWKL